MIIDRLVSIVTIRLIARDRSRVVRIPDAISPEPMRRSNSTVGNGDKRDLCGIVESGDVDAWEWVES